jgi:outer membrane lipoprotein SlyB
MMNIKIPNIAGESTPQYIIGKNFYIAKGVIVFKNKFVALEAISTAKINQDADATYGKLWYWLGGGIVAVVIGIAFKSILIAIAGIVVALVAAILIHDIWQRNHNKSYNVDIRLNNGERIVYCCNTLKTAQDIMDAIIDCINNRFGGYQIMNNNVTKIDDHSVGKISVGGNFNGDLIVGENNTITKANNGSSVNASVYKELTDDEWMRLEKFLEKRQTELVKSSSDMENCKNALKSVQNRDKSGFKRIYASFSKVAREELFTAGVETAVKSVIVPIVNKLIK